MQVEILAHTPNIENVLASAGRLCYSKVGVSELLEKYSQEDNERFVKMLANMGHESPLEHVSFTFAVEGISRACSHQLVRHRIASYSQQSQRYVNLDKTFEYITPPSIKNTYYINQIYNNAMEDAFNAYVKISRDLLIVKCYEYLVEIVNAYSADIQQDEEFILDVMRNKYKGKYNKFEKEAIEDARYILPNACETKLVFTMNVRTLLNFFEKRCCNRAQWEIRDLANEMLRQCREISPILFNNAGATCKRGYCKEGDMSCKK